MTLVLHEPTGATPLTTDEMLGLKAGHVTTRGELNELENANILEGLQWLDARPTSFDVLTDDCAKKVHSRLFGKVWAWAGDYRLTEKNIGVQVWHISTEMRTCLDDARYWREHQTFEPIEAAARFHHKLVWIHPFANGNGRWSRIMADTYLAKLDPDTFLDWSSSGDLQTENDHRNRYLSALRSADQYDFEPLIEFAYGIAG